MVHGKNTIQVSNLSTNIQVKELISLFEGFGHIESASIEWKNGKRKDKFTARVTFDSERAAEEARNKYHEAELDENKIYIKILGGR